MKKFKTLKSQVLYVLEKLPEARDCDVRLTTGIWLKFYPDSIHASEDGTKYLKLRDMKTLPREDHVGRVRRKVQNEELKFLPTTPEIAKKRGIAKEEWERALGYRKPYEISFEGKEFNGLFN